MALAVVRLGLLSAVSLLCAGCLSSLTVSEADVRAAYKAEPGPLAVVSKRRLALDNPELERPLQMRVAYPEAPGSYPLIVLSHGNGCLQDLYVGFADHWVSWGYVVIQPVHMDSRELGFSMKGVTMEVMNQVISTRRQEVRFILDSLDQIEDSLPGLAGQIDRDNLVIAGHSMGGGTAMSLSGVRMIDPRDNSLVESDEDRFDALILISDPSNNRLMPNEAWKMAKVPTFIATGTEDFSTLGSRDGVKNKSAYQLVTNPDQLEQPHYYLNMDGSDHYLGGAICRSNVPGPRDLDAVNIINGSSTAFLDAYVKGDKAALKFLTADEIEPLTDGRATLELR
jgi:dienelactone hydrolase